MRHHYAGRKHVFHPVVGDLYLTFESMELPADPGLSLIIYNAEPGSSSQDGLKMLASWAATVAQTELPDHSVERPQAISAHRCLPIKDGAPRC